MPFLRRRDGVHQVLFYYSLIANYIHRKVPSNDVQLPQYLWDNVN